MAGGAGDAETARVEGAIVALGTQTFGSAPTRLEWIDAGLGLRGFARLRLSGAPGTVIARVEAPEDLAGRPTGAPAEPPLEPIRAHLERGGLPVPKCWARNAALGIALLEDVGTVCLNDAAVQIDAKLRRARYAEACDLVPRLQSLPADPAVEAYARHLDDALFAYKADLFATYSLAVRSRETTPAEREAVRDAFTHVAETSSAAPDRLAHRDFQSANLHVVPGRAGGEVVMIDLQGAFLAPPEYDLVCLLRDSYAELEQDEIDAHLARVRPKLPDAPDPETFARRFDLLTLTRKGKDHARFVYAARERGDTRFLRFIPATVRALRGAAARAAAREPAMNPLAALLAELPETPAEPSA